jgi:hypothetical protein
MSLGKNEIALFACALVIYLAIIVLFSYWFVGDEGYYSLSIFEAIKNGPQLFITFLGTPIFWKPFLMVDVYSFIAGPLAGMVPAQIAYRIPSAIFSAINVVLAYAIAKEFVGEKKALLVAAVYMLNPVILLFGTKIFMETIAMTFVFAGLYATIALCKEKKDNWALCLGIALAMVGAAFAKSTTIGLMALLLYAMYAFFANRKKLVGIGIAGAVAVIVICLVPFLTQFPEAFFKLYGEDFFTKRIGTNIFGTNIVETLAATLYLIPVLFVSIRGINIKEWKNIFILLWLLPLLAIMILTPFTWYAYYFILPLALLAVKGLSDNIMDVGILGVLVLMGVYFGYFNIERYSAIPELKTVDFIAQNISKDSCVLFTGAISPMSYSYLETNRYNFNVVITNSIYANGTDRIYDANISQAQLDQLINNYEKADFIDGLSKRKYLFTEWNRFTDEMRVRTENYNCTKFDYVIVTDYYRKYDVPGYELVRDANDTRVWKKIIT